MEYDTEQEKNILRVMASVNFLFVYGNILHFQIYTCAFYVLTFTL